MRSWLRRRGETAKRIEAEADVLVRDFGTQAYSVARRREQEASSHRMTQEWNRIALAVAQKTHRRMGLDTGTRMAMDADPAAGPMTREIPQFYDARSQLDEIERILKER